MKKSQKTGMKMFNHTDLKKYGIGNVKEVYYNLSYEELFEHETNPELEGFERGFVTKSGAVAVDTGIFTGRSPKDKYIVKQEESRDKVWWANPGINRSDNHPISESVWSSLLETTVTQLNGKKLYVMDAYCGANENSRMKIRVITEVAWMAHFVKNMFIRPSEDELIDFEPDFVMLNACKAINHKWEEQNLNSDVYVAFNLRERLSVVGGTWYGGEIKKGFFTIMNYYLPLEGMASMHCSANMGKNGDTAIFFGLSGTGKTTLSADPSRYLIGDDEHGWDDEGIFNFEGGCYAKCVALNKEKEPDIYNAIRRDALLENVVFDPKTGEVNYYDTSKTENTRVSYPIHHIENIVKPVSKGTHPKKIIFLTADAFGVLPPVAKLSREQAKYYFLSGYTAKLAGTERGVREPIPTFSGAFGAAFLMLHPTYYAKELARKMKEHGSTAYLVNTGWLGGAYGAGKRIDLETTRNIIAAILDGSLDKAEYEELNPFGLMVPKDVDGVDPAILNPRLAWKYESQYQKQAEMLAEKFIENFQRFTDTEEGARLVAAGPQNHLMKQYYSYYQRRMEKMEKKHAEEILRLRDQIFILHNSFAEYISFNSISTEYKNLKFNRYVPASVFIETENLEEQENCLKSVLELMKAVGLRIEKEGENKDGFAQYICITKDPISIKEVNNIIDELLGCFKDKKCNMKDLESVKLKLMEAIKGIPRLSLKIGSFLLIKDILDETEKPTVFVKKLSISSLIRIDKDQDLLKEPAKLYEELIHL